MREIPETARTIDVNFSSPAGHGLAASFAALAALVPS
jgi:hypothetical protein